VLAKAKLKIYISFDLWTSPNTYVIYIICAYFIRLDYANHSVLLGIKRMLRTYHGEDILEVILPILEEYKISPKLDVFITNNTDSNNTVIRVTL
jgi:hypothetical protein